MTVALGVEGSASVVFVVSLHPDLADGSIYAVIDGKAHLDGHIHSRGCGDGHAAAGHARPAHGDSPINQATRGITASPTITTTLKPPMTPLPPTAPSTVSSTRAKTTRLLMNGR